MIYRAVRVDKDAFLTGGTNSIVDAPGADSEESFVDAPSLFMYPVRVGIEMFWVAAEDVAAIEKKAKRLVEMARRVDQDDAFMRVHTTDDGEFVEFVSPQLGYAWKAVSKYNREPVEYYIGAGTPWVKWNKEESTSEAMFDDDAYDYEPRAIELKELGFDEPYVWYPATREKIKTSTSDKKKWVWKRS